MRRKKTWVLLLLFFVMLAAFGIFLFSLKITKYTVIGSTRYTAEEIFEWIFPEEDDKRLVVRTIRNILGKEETVTIPFVLSYELNYISATEVEIVVYEKGLLGYIEYMGTNLYLDAEGYVVEVSPEVLPGLPQIAGIYFDYFVLNDQLPVADPSIFSSVAEVAGEIDWDVLEVSRITFNRNQEITLTLGEIQVMLGSNQDLKQKMKKLSEVYSTIKGRKGILHLENYADDPDGGFRFQVIIDGE